MNDVLSPLWTSTTSALRMTGTWRSATPDYRNMPSPCLGACPVDGHIAEWIGEIDNGDYHAAWLTLLENNPFPAIAGRICHHPCETACNRQYLDETVGICSLERFVGDMALTEGWKVPQPKVERRQSVAIIGSGPAGLSAAFQLRRAGYQVTIIEKHGELGGLMRYGIPAYRLNRKILDGEIDRIIDMGISVALNTEIADSAGLKKLQAKHDAVYLATGASCSKTLPALDYDQPWVMDSAEFLAATNTGQTCTLGKRIAVIGGGSAAMDVARTARRLDRSVTVLSLEPDDLLPAQRTEVEEAREEGVEFTTGSMVRSVESGKNGLTIHCVKVEFYPGEMRGQFTTKPVEGSEFTLSADAVIPAIGQDIDAARWNGLLDCDGPVINTDDEWQTSAPGIYAGGDVASQDRFVTQAVGMGKQAANAIIRRIDPQNAQAIPVVETEIPFSTINTAYFPPAVRNKTENTDVPARLAGFQEVQLPLALQAAVAEAKRCFSCGTCIFCDNCYFYCPDMAIIKLERGYEVKTDYCKGCGLCVEECPTGSINMLEELFA